MAQIKESTAYVRMFQMDAEGLTVAVALSKGGTAFDAAVGLVAEIGGGWYSLALTAADTDTPGDLAFACSAAGADTVTFVDQVLPNPGDDPWAVALPGAYAAGTAGQILGDRLDVDVSSRSAHVPADIWEAATRELTGFGTLAGDVWEVAERTLTDKADFALSAASVLAIWEQAAAAMTEAGTLGRLIVDQFQAVLDRLGLPAGASVTADIAAVQGSSGDVQAILGAPAGASLAADLAALHADVTDGVALTAASAEGVADAVLNRNIGGGANGGRTVGSALASSRNKVARDGGLLYVYATDDTTVLYTAAVTSAPGDPIISIDPVS